MSKHSQPIENNPDITPADLEALHRDLYQWAYSNVSFDRELANDVLQETYLRIWNGKARFDGLSSLKTWLYAVIRNIAVDYQRSASAAAESLLRFQLLSVDMPENNIPDAVYYLAAESRRILSALMKLSPQQRLILELVFFNDMTIEEAAVVMSVSVGAARQHYTRGKKSLNRLLGETCDSNGNRQNEVKQYG